MIGRDLSDAIRAAEPCGASEPILFTADDEISEGNEAPASPFQKAARLLHRSGTIVQPNHLETVIAEVDVDGERHLVKFSRYHDNQQFWTVPGERDERIHNSKTFTVTEPEPDEYELYDLTVDPYEERNLAHPTHADDRSRRLEAHMFELLVQQLAKKRLVPTAARCPATGRQSPLQRSGPNTDLIVEDTSPRTTRASEPSRQSSKPRAIVGLSAVPAQYFDADAPVARQSFLRAGGLGRVLDGRDGAHDLN